VQMLDGRIESDRKNGREPPAEPKA
jgi:hypothetical protein